MSFSQLESLLGSALGNGGIEELMAGAGLNGKNKYPYLFTNLDFQNIDAYFQED